MGRFSAGPDDFVVAIRGEVQDFSQVIIDVMVGQVELEVGVT